jgi:hypothetical protein
LTTIIIGLGGTGASTILNIKKALYENERNALAIEDPPRFLSIDSDIRSKKLSLSVSFTHDTIIEEPYTLPELVMLDPGIGITSESYKQELSFIPPHQKPYLNQVGQSGAQGRKILGRGAFILKAQAIRASIQQLAQGAPCQVYICGSLCGGTGAGSFIDLAYIVKDALKENCREINGFFALSTLYAGLASTPHAVPNCFASIKELDHFEKYGFGLMDRDEPIYQQYIGNNIWIKSKSGPYTRVFLFESQNSAGVTTNLNGMSSIVARFIISMTKQDFFTAILNNESAKFRYNESPLVQGELSKKNNNHYRAYGGAGFFEFRYPKKEIIYARSALLAIDLIDSLCTSPGTVVDFVKTADDYMKSGEHAIWWEKSNPRAYFGVPFHNELDIIVPSQNKIYENIRDCKSIEEAHNRLEDLYKNKFSSKISAMAVKLKNIRHSFLDSFESRLDYFQKDIMAKKDDQGHLLKGSLTYLVQVLEYISKDIYGDISDLKSLYQASLGAEGKLSVELKRKIGLFDKLNGALDQKFKRIAEVYYLNLRTQIFREMLATFEGDPSDTIKSVYRDGAYKTILKHKSKIEDRILLLKGDYSRNIQGFRDDLLDILHNVKVITNDDSAVILLFDNEIDINDFYRKKYTIDGSLKLAVYSEACNQVQNKFKNDLQDLFTIDVAKNKEILVKQNKKDFLDIIADILERDFEDFSIKDILYRQYVTVRENGDLDIPIIRGSQQVYAFDCCKPFLTFNSNALRELGVTDLDNYSLAISIPENCMPCNPQDLPECNYNINGECPEIKANPAFIPEQCFGCKLSIHREQSIGKLGFKYAIDLHKDKFSIRLISAIGGLLPQGIPSLMNCEPAYQSNISVSMFPPEEIHSLDERIELSR